MRWGAMLVVALAVGAAMVRVNRPSAAAGAADQSARFAAAIADSLCATPGGKSTFQRETDTGMARMVTDMHAPGYSGNVDADLLAMTVPHPIEIHSMRRRLPMLQQPGSENAEDAFPALGGTRGP